MEEKQILKDISRAINDKHFDVEIDIVKPSFIQRLRKEKVKLFSVRRACLSTLLTFGEIVLDFKTNYYKDATFTASQMVEAVCTDARVAVKAIAILLLNTENKKNSSLERFLLKNLDSDDCRHILLRLIEHSKMENFISSIILVKGMSLLKTEEMIAFENKISGQLSEEP